MISSHLHLRLISVLDQVELRVERLRRDTVRIEEERDSLLSTLDSVKHSDLLSDITECKLIKFSASITYKTTIGIGGADLS